MQYLTTLFILATSLSLTPSTTALNTTAAAAAAATSLAAPPSAASLAAANLPGGTANLTLIMYGDPDCTDFNSTATTLTNQLPLSYDKPSPQFPFWGFIMTRNLTGTEQLSFYSSSNTSTEACGEALGNVNATLGLAGYCVPIGGATCYNLTKS